ncbi:heterokaryon incompatibility protein-domain-containing protein [Podospora didyma]|uniref:Heterokaryon incompatibility protein-domain-containing protein n=1 Tax=Podospora didyma TaxID=330526 RepID=A0AAE0NQ91_9PEZI|nr:heterokaryon incompatibility protein-domain-containing protein [Podospora didyma]
MSLCETCRDNLQAIRIQYDADSPNLPNGTHHGGVLSFLAAVDARCYICWKAYRALSASGQGLLRRLGRELEQLGANGIVAGTNFSFMVFHKSTGLHLNIWVPFLREYALRVSDDYPSLDGWTGADGAAAALCRELEACVVDDTRTMLSSLDDVKAQQYVKQRRPSSSRTDGAEIFEIIQQWLQDCLQHHKSCNDLPNIQDWRPTRLLEIGDTDDEGRVLSCRLVDRHDALQDRQGYVTISHRWGTEHFITLTTDNLSQLKDGIPLDLIPRTFLDCMFVAKRLGVRYIWIDSLCIVQSGDGGQDWRQESVQMHFVYRNAFCNIMASWATAQDGIFYDRDLRLFDQVFTDLTVVDSSDKAARKPFTFVEQGIWSNQVWRSPLNRRAWVFQERLLSRRNLHFCQREVFWECRERACSETMPDMRYNVPSSDNWNLDFRDDEIHLKSFEPRAANANYQSSGCFTPVDMQYTLWADIVKPYSKGELTKSSDKLVALSGIAQHMVMKGNMGDDVYVAGLWLRHLAAEVLWMRVDPYYWTDWTLSKAMNSSIQRVYQAPSFSWASIHNPGHGVMPGPPLSVGIIVDVCCVDLRPQEAAHDMQKWKDQPVTEDIFGPLSAPVVELRVVGRVMPVRLVASESETESVLRLHPLGCYENEMAAQKERESSTVAMLALDHPVPKAEADAFCQKVYYCIPWQDDNVTTPAGDPNSDQLIRFRCLVVELVDAEMARFRRIGLFIKTRSVPEDVYLSSWGYERSVPCWKYDETTEAHTIYII